MKIQITKQHIDLDEKSQAHVEEKVLHLEHFSDELKDESVTTQIHVALDSSHSKNGHVNMEVTIRLSGAIIRAEVKGTTVNEAVDIAVEKLKKQIEKYKGKKHRRDQSGKWIPTSTLEEISEKTGPEKIAEIVKRKRIKDLNLMHEDEALHQMELLDHDFFIYKDVDSGQYNVLYKRHNGGYGAMELE